MENSFAPAPLISSLACLAPSRRPFRRRISKWAKVLKDRGESIPCMLDKCTKPIFFVFPLGDFAPLRKEENQHWRHKSCVPVQPIGLQDSGAIFNVCCRRSVGNCLRLNEVLSPLKAQKDHWFWLVFSIILTAFDGFGHKGEIGCNGWMDSGPATHESDHWHWFLAKLFGVLLHSQDMNSRLSPSCVLRSLLSEFYMLTILPSSARLIENVPCFKWRQATATFLDLTRRGRYIYSLRATWNPQTKLKDSVYIHE